MKIQSTHFPEQRHAHYKHSLQKLLLRQPPTSFPPANTAVPNSSTSVTPQRLWHQSEHTSRAVTAPRRLSVQRRNNNHPASTDRARARARELANEAPLQVAARRPPSNTTSSSRPSRTSSWSGSFGRCPWRSALSTGDSRLRTLEKAYLFGSKRLRWLGGRRAEGAEKSTAMMVDGETDPGKSGKEQKHNLFRIL